MHEKRNSGTHIRNLSVNAKGNVRRGRPKSSAKNKVHISPELKKRYQLQLVQEFGQESFIASALGDMDLNEGKKVRLIMTDVADISNIARIIMKYMRKLSKSFMGVWNLFTWKNFIKGPASCPLETIASLFSKIASTSSENMKSLAVHLSKVVTELVDFLTLVLIESGPDLEFEQRTGFEDVLHRKTKVNPDLSDDEQTTCAPTVCETQVSLIKNMFFELQSLLGNIISAGSTVAQWSIDALKYIAKPFVYLTRGLVALVDKGLDLSAELLSKVMNYVLESDNPALSKLRRLTLRCFMFCSSFVSTIIKHGNYGIDAMKTAIKDGQESFKKLMNDVVNNFNAFKQSISQSPLADLMRKTTFVSTEIWMQFSEDLLWKYEVFMSLCLGINNWVLKTIECAKTKLVSFISTLMMNSASVFAKFLGITLFPSRGNTTYEKEDIDPRKTMRDATNSLLGKLEKIKNMKGLSREKRLSPEVLRAAKKCESIVQTSLEEDAELQEISERHQLKYKIEGVKRDVKFCVESSDHFSRLMADNRSRTEGSMSLGTPPDWQTEEERNISLEKEEKMAYDYCGKEFVEKTGKAKDTLDKMILGYRNLCKALLGDQRWQKISSIESQISDNMKLKNIGAPTFQDGDDSGMIIEEVNDDNVVSGNSPSSGIIDEIPKLPLHLGKRSRHKTSNEDKQLEQTSPAAKRPGTEVGSKTFADVMEKFMNDKYEIVLQEADYSLIKQAYRYSLKVFKDTGVEENLIKKYGTTKAAQLLQDFTVDELDRYLSDQQNRRIRRKRFIWAISIAISIGTVLVFVYMMLPKTGGYDEETKEATSNAIASHYGVTGAVTADGDFRMINEEKSDIFSDLIQPRTENLQQQTLQSPWDVGNFDDLYTRAQKSITGGVDKLKEFIDSNKKELLKNRQTIALNNKEMNERWLNVRAWAVTFSLGYIPPLETASDSINVNVFNPEDFTYFQENGMRHVQETFLKLCKDKNFQTGLSHGSVSADIVSEIEKGLRNSVNGKRDFFVPYLSSKVSGVAISYIGRLVSSLAPVFPWLSEGGWVNAIQTVIIGGAGIQLALFYIVKVPLFIAAAILYVYEISADWLGTELPDPSSTEIHPKIVARVLYARRTPESALRFAELNDAIKNTVQTTFGTMLSKFGVAFTALKPLVISLFNNATILVAIAMITVTVCVFSSVFALIYGLASLGSWALWLGGKALTALPFLQPFIGSELQRMTLIDLCPSCRNSNDRCDKVTCPYCHKHQYCNQQCFSKHWRSGHKLECDRSQAITTVY